MLSRLVEDPLAFGTGRARSADCSCISTKVDEAIAAGDATLLHSRDGEACVRGCYRCLLSYFNQPDHELIDQNE